MKLLQQKYCLSFGIQTNTLKMDKWLGMNSKKHIHLYDNKHDLKTETGTAVKDACLVLTKNEVKQRLCYLNSF